MSRGDQPRVHRERPSAAERTHFAFLDHAEQLRLDLRGQLSDLVQEQRAPICAAEQPGCGAHRSGERPALVAEEFAFGDPLGKRAAVHWDERTLAARRCRVDRARDQLLSGTALGFDQHRALVPRQVGHLAQHAAHCFGLEDHAVEGGGPAEFALEFAVADAQPAPLERAAERLDDPVPIVEGFFQVIEGARSHRGHGRVDAGVAGHHHDLAVWTLLANLADQVDTRNTAESQVEQYQFRLLRQTARDGVSIASFVDHESLAFEQTAQRPKQWSFVVDQKYARIFRALCLVEHRSPDRCAEKVA